MGETQSFQAEETRPFLYAMGALSHLAVPKPIFSGRQLITVVDEGFTSFDTMCHKIENFLLRCATELSKEDYMKDMTIAHSHLHYVLLRCAEGWC